MRTLQFTSMAALISVLVVAVSVCGQTQPKPQNPPEHPSFELNTVLMECTFALDGHNSNGQDTIGTVFIMGRPIPNSPKRLRYVLITAAHVLNDIAGDFATLHLRRKLGENNWMPAPIQIPIRANGRPLWAKHPSADVAVMYVKLPTYASIPLLPTSVLVDDATLSRLEIHPGDELKCLGYPMGQASNAAGFPILRSGMIASYPLLPTAVIKTFLLDIRVFKGNSGGPVYLDQSNRAYGHAVHIGTVGFIAGLVSAERLSKQHIVAPYSEETRDVQLSLAIVVDASLIKQAIEMLPKP